MLNFFLLFVRNTLALRYKTEFHNFEVFDTKNPIIVFPNHPALVDPLIVVSNIGKKKILSPIMTETYFNIPWLGGIIRAMGTVPVGDISRGGSAEDVKKAFVGIRSAIQNRQDITLYPSGHIYVQPFEHIVGKKMAFEIVKMLDTDTRVIVLRTKWLWGSIWSKAFTGTSPELGKVLVKSIWIILANFIFFVPKRKVNIECVDMTEQLKAWQAEGLDSFNQKLQDFYNEAGEETCQFIPHYSYYNDIAGKQEPQNIAGSVAEISMGSGISIDDIPEEVFEFVRQQVAEVKKIEVKDLKFDTHLILDLRSDSLDMAEMKSAVQSMFPNASNPPIWLIKTIGDLAAMAIGKLQGEEKLPPMNFVPATDLAIDVSFTPGDTILSLMKQNFKKYRNDAFIYDAMTGSMTRDQFLLKSYVIAECLKKYPGEKIGIMIPALSATSLLLVGSYLAGKLPVMLNWTVGEISFAHCMNFAGLDTILTSRKFYEKITSPWLEKFEGKMVYIEDIIRDIPLMVKLMALTKKSLFFLPKPRNEAVMLFTSGSESLPKAVVLTHENILSDIDGALKLVPFHQFETLLGFLPPFHSFGFTLNTIFPLLTPIQVAYTPDPSDSRTIGKILKHTSATIVSATPTFLKMILAGNTSEQVQSLRYAFVGAEKCSDDIFAMFHEKCPEAVILEGYGITECSPIVTVNPLVQQKKWSAGKFLPQVEFVIRSLDGKGNVPMGEQGMIYVAGPSIFGGYLDTNIESPFEMIDGKSWYKTGDLGYVDTEKFLYITGRLKRFVKIAGEMISLPFIEGILLQKYGNPEFTTLAIEAKEENGNVTIVAFMAFDISVEVLNDHIHANGASNLVKFSRVERLDTIPVLGTGKTDYKSLKWLI